MGANKPDAGVRGRGADAGVLGRTVKGDFAREGVTGGRSDVLDAGRGRACVWDCEWTSLTDDDDRIVPDGADDEGGSDGRGWT